MAYQRKERPNRKKKQIENFTLDIDEYTCTTAKFTVFHVYLSMSITSLVMDIDGHW